MHPSILELPKIKLLFNLQCHVIGNFWRRMAPAGSPLITVKEFAVVCSILNHHASGLKLIYKTLFFIKKNNL